MKTFLTVAGIVLAVILALFILTFIIYIFNLDMKLMAALEPRLGRIYDKRKRERRM